MTRAPSRAKRLTVSDPINPADPVTMIVRIMSNSREQVPRPYSGERTSIACSPQSELFPNDPCDFARRRIHPCGGELPVALKHTLDQFGILRRADEKQNVPGTIDERKCERQSPGVQFGNKICHDCTRHLFQCGGPGKE